MAALLAASSGCTEPTKEQETAVGNIDEIGRYAYQGELPSETELAMYRSQSPAPCQGESADQAVRVGITNHWRWAVRYRTEGADDKDTLLVFDNSKQALRYLVEDLDCADPLIQYRYANNKHMQREYERAADVFEKAVGGLEKHYPRMLPMARRQYAEALGVIGDVDAAIAQQRQILELVPDSVSAALNLANRLSRRLEPGDTEDARELVARARHLGVSGYGEDVIQKIEARLDSSAENE